MLDDRTRRLSRRGMKSTRWRKRKREKEANNSSRTCRFEAVARAVVQRHGAEVSGQTLRPLLAPVPSFSPSSIFRSVVFLLLPLRLLFLPSRILSLSLFFRHTRAVYRPLASSFGRLLSSREVGCGGSTLPSLNYLL